MRPMVRGLVAAGIIGFALLAGWRIVGSMQAERYAERDPGKALQWQPRQPAALATVAQQALDAGGDDAAAETAALILQQEPLRGVAYRIIAESTERQGNRELALQRYELAASRAPRDLKANAWLVGSYIDQGDYRQALRLVDRMLRVAPGRTKETNEILKAIAPLAQNDQFADALVVILQENPPWRPTMMKFLGAYPDAASYVMQGLSDAGGLSAGEYAGWLDRLVSAGKWSEAYARWAGRAVKETGRLPLLYNGNFPYLPSNVGFDWRLKQIPGVIASFEPVAGIQGTAVRFQFIDQRIPQAGLEQPLLLFPGHYRLAMRMRADALRGEIGMQWILTCAGKAGEIGRSEPVSGTFGWRHMALDFTVPADHCPGIWLRLVNPVASGAGQRLAGELWVAEVELERLPPP